MEFRKLQSLVEVDLSDCSKLGCLPNSIVDLSQLKTFQLWGCHKLENLKVEFGKLQSFYSIVSSWGVYLIQLWTCLSSRHFD